MAFAVLVGVVLLLGLGLVVALKVAADARRDLDDLEEEIADARGLGLNLARDPDPESWSAGDFEILRDDVDEEYSDDPYASLRQGNSPGSWEIVRDDIDEEEDAHEPYATLTQGDSAESWQVSPRLNGSEGHASPVAQPAADTHPLTWQTPGDTPMVVLVVGVGFLGAGGAAVTTAARLQVPFQEMHPSPHARGANNTDVPPLSSFYDAAVVRDEIDRNRLGDSPPLRRDERPSGNGHQSGSGPEPERIAWRPPTEVKRAR